VVEALVVFLAWLFQGSVGFGAGILIVGFLSLFEDPKAVVVSSAPVNLAGNLAVLYRLKSRPPAYRLLFYLIAGSFAGIALSGKVLVEIDRRLLSLIIGLFILSLGLWDAYADKVSLRIKREALWGFLSGFSGGLFAGLVGVGGPPPAVFLKRVCEDPHRVKSTLAFYFTFNVLARLFFYALYGGLTFVEGKFLLLGVPSALAGALLGLSLSSKLRSKTLRTLMSSAVLLSGFFLLLKSLFELGFLPSKDGSVN